MIGSVHSWCMELAISREKYGLSERGSASEAEKSVIKNLVGHCAVLMTNTFELCLLHVHCNGLRGIEDALGYDWTEFFEFWDRETTLVGYLHLVDKGALSGIW